MATSTSPVGLFLPPDDADLVVGEAEVFAESVASLGQEWFAVDQDQRGLAVVGDDGAGGHGFPGPGPCDDHGEIVVDDGIDRRLLVRSQGRDEVELGSGMVPAPVGEIDAAAGGLDEFGDLVVEAAGKVEPFEVLAVAADEPGGVSQVENRIRSFWWNSGFASDARCFNPGNQGRGEARLGAVTASLPSGPR